MFTPIVDRARLEPLVDAHERSRQEIEALHVPAMLARWLQRITEARGAHMSTRIEGNPMTEQEVRETFARPERRTDAAEIENLNYRDAIHFVTQTASDPVTADLDAGLVRAIHFLVLKDVDRYGTAGRYRTEQNAVRHAGQTIYLPPPPAEVGRLMADLLTWVNTAQRDGVHPLAVAAVAHAEFINIHPFDDGNGRTGRALTSFLLKRSRWTLRGFVSVEQVFGADIADYYAELQKFGPRYPGQQVDFTSWTAWFLIRLLIETTTEAGTARGWLDALEAFASETALPDRLAEGLGYIWLVGTISRSEYAAALGVSPATAVDDLNSLVDRGLIRREGRGRSTQYVSLDSPLAGIVEHARLDATRRVTETFDAGALSAALGG